MIRREFLEKSAIAGTGLLLSANGFIPTANENKFNLPKMKLQWCNYKTTRPFTPDVDSNGTIWFGSYEHFFSLNTMTMKVEEHDATFLQGKPLSTSICQNNKIYILAQKSPYIFVYDPSQKKFSKHALPDSESNIWFGLRVVNDHRLYLYVRNRSKLLVWD